MMAVALAALVAFAILNRHGWQAAPVAPVADPVTRQVVQPVESGIKPADRSAQSTPEPNERITTLIAALRPKVDAALRGSDFQAADRHVDEVLATPGLEPLEKQRLMVVKMAARGMRGDHAAMLALMDEIIAVAPNSALSAQLGKERPQIEKIQRLGPNHPELCETCGQMHNSGAHPAAKDANEPRN